MAGTLAERVVAGERGAAARLIRIVDDGDPEGREALGAVHRAAAGARIVGVTGSPGSGKSTIVDRLIEKLRARGERVGVVAVDPSSPFSGGAILGDRIRMQRHAGDDGVFIRSLATRGHLGGLSASARDVLAVLAAAGFRTLLVETVGVGQDEVEVARVADTVVLVLVPGAGDAIQTMKAGVMEIADVFVVNKMDRPGADETAREIEHLLAGSPAAGGAWTPPVTLACAADGRGVDDLLAAVDRHAAYLADSGAELSRRTERAGLAIRDFVHAAIDARLQKHLSARLALAARRVASGASDPRTEAAGIEAELMRSTTDRGDSD